MPTRPTNVSLRSSAVDILNAIRNSATANYRDYVPAATDDLGSIREIGAVIMNFPALQNEFLNALVNRIGRVILTSKMFSNPWNVFKQGVLDFGETIEEIFVNIAKPFEYDPAVAENKVFAREIPDVRAAFHILNYQKFYKATIQQEQLRQAFLSWQGITDLIAKIVDAMYSGANYDEFQTMKYMLAKHILNGELYPKQIATVQASNMKAIVSTIKGVSNDLEFPKTKYNIAGVTTFTPKENQYIIVNSEFDAGMDVEVLASAFNMSKAEFMGHRVLVDNFGDFDDTRLAQLFANDKNFVPLTSPEKAALNAIPAVLIDKDWFMIFDNLYNFTENYNGEGLYWNYWYHVWKTFSVSPFANAVVYVPGVPSITSVSVSPASATVGRGQSILLSATVVTDNFASKAVDWTLTGAKPTGLLVNGGGSAVTAGTAIIPVDGTTIVASALIGATVHFGSDTTNVYTITANTTTSITLDKGLVDNVADNAAVTFDTYPVIDEAEATISPLGVLTISTDAIAGDTITVTATSVIDSTKSDTATITVA